MNEHVDRNRLIDFKRAIKTLDYQITLQKLKKYQFEHCDIPLIENNKDHQETDRDLKKAVSLFSETISNSRTVTNPFKSKLLSRIKN